MRLIRADVTSQNRRKVARLQAGNDELARRIVELAEREALDAIRPDIDGSRIMEILGLEPGRLVGQARDFLLELRLEEGPLGQAEAERRLLAWWAERDGDAAAGSPSRSDGLKPGPDARETGPDAAPEGPERPMRREGARP